MDAAAAVYCGFADHVVPSENLDALRAALRQAQGPETPAERIDRSLSSSKGDETPGPSSLEAARAWIDDAFAADTVADIIERLRAHSEPDAGATADVLEELSPTALAVTLGAVRAARQLPDLRAALAQEYGLVMWFGTTQPDLVEGIRAQLVDKDRSPRWSPATLAELPAEVAASALSFVPPRPLWD
jgi:enoyl-CoA hydratase